MSSNYKTILITGSNRGIGLGFAKYYVKKDYKVIATCRNPSGAKELKNLAKQYDNLYIEQLDVTNEEHHKNLYNKYKNSSIDILINNAGVYPEHHEKISISKTGPSWIEQAFKVNCLGAFYLLHYFKEGLQKSLNPKVINMASQAGSIEQTKAGFGYSYRISKAALNMLTKTFASECPEIITISLRPGWVKTQMGGEKATLEIDDSISNMVVLIDKLQSEDSGKFLDAMGNVEKW